MNFQTSFLLCWITEKTGAIVCDYISGMTDQYAITKFHEYFVPVAWEIDGY